MNKKERGKEGSEKWGSGEDVSQAVVIADSFNFRFLPVTAEKPRALIPLVNRPLIDYTVEFLVVSGVEEIFVYCCAHSDLLKKYLAQSRWNKPGSPVRLHTIIAEDCPSVGDALRDIDSQALIRSDFVLVSGDLVSNMELREVINKHKQLKQTDKMTVMTNVYKKAAPGHRTRSVEDDILVATNSSDGRLLFCEKPTGKKKLAVPVEIFEENGEVDIHYDVLDCHISVCSPSVPQLFSDNFDYQTRYHFIRGIIVNEEVLGNHMYAHFISDQYAARVSNLQTYDSISSDVIHRWVYPLVPDNTLTGGYSYGRRNIYLGSLVQLAFGCELKEDVVIGPSSKIGTGTIITHSSIGRNCTIGKGVSIVGCYIWDNVVIGDGCKLNKSILADNVELKLGVEVEPGCIISFKVIIGANFVVKSGSRLTTSVHSSLPSGDGWEDDFSEAVTQSKPVDMAEEVGEGGRGFRWEPPTVDSDDGSENLFVEQWNQDTVEQEDEVESSDSEVSPEATPEPIARLTSEAEADSVFYYEVLDSIRSGVTDGVPNDNTILMINSSKHAYNIPIQEVPLAVVKAILEGQADANPHDKSLFFSYAQKSFTHYQPLLSHYIKDSRTQLSVLQCLTDCACQGNSSILAFLPKIVLLLYNLDIIEETAIVSWNDGLSRAERTLQQEEILQKMRPVIEWLQNAEEESEESD